MRIEIAFHADPDDESVYAKLDGKRIVMKKVDNLHVDTGVDTFPGPEPGSKLPGETGSLALGAHGSRALWDEPATGRDGGGR